MGAVISPLRGRKYKNSAPPLDPVDESTAVYFPAQARWRFVGRRGTVSNLIQVPSSERFGGSESTVYNFGPGDRVLYLHKYPAVVKSMEPVPFAKEFGTAWVELDEPREIGRSRTMKKQVHVRGCLLFRFSREVQAAVRVQCLARGFLARLLATAKMNWLAYNLLDNHEEKLHLVRSQTLENNPELQDALESKKRSFRIMTTTGRMESLSGSLTEILTRENEMLRDTGTLRSTGMEARRLNAMAVEPSYSGPIWTWPLTPEQLESSIDRFSKGEVLHFKFVMQLLAEFRSLAKSFMDNVTKLSIPKGGHVTIVGDLHGHFKDLVHIIKRNGDPAPNNLYVFNGDFVDRGSQGLEVLIVLFAWKVMYPEYVHLNRGNHEDRSQNQHYSRGKHGCWGFLEELAAKYTSHGTLYNKLYNSIEGCFHALPLATLIDDAVLVVHGGLPRLPDVTIADINACKRCRPIPFTKNLNRDPSEPVDRHDMIFEDLMWSDPANSSGLKDSTRHAGALFGPDITKHFLEVNRLKLVVRSHECVDEGFNWQSGRNLVTVFSASNYNGYYNKGAILTLSDNLTLTTYTYDTQSGNRQSQRNRQNLHNKHIVEMLQDRICVAKPQLFRKFSELDTARVGYISRSQWAAAMGEVLDLPSLPWLYLSKFIADVTPQQTVHYSGFLDRYRVIMAGDQPWQEAVVSQICQKLLCACGDLEQAFKLFDTNHDGLVEYSEFVAALKSVDLQLSDAQIYELMRTMDLDASGFIDFSEFVSRFDTYFVATKRANTATQLLESPSKISLSLVTDDEMDAASGDIDSDPSNIRLDEGTEQMLHRIGSAMFTWGRDFKNAFRLVDTNADGWLSMEEFTQAVDTLLPGRYSLPEVERIFRLLDVDSSGSLDYREFIRGFRVRIKYKDVEPCSAPSQEGFGKLVVDRILGTLYDYLSELQSLFVALDPGGLGMIHKTDFKAGIRTVLNTAAISVTDSQLDLFLNDVSSDVSDVVNYQGFLESFSVVDRAIMSPP